MKRFLTRISAMVGLVIITYAVIVLVPSEAATVRNSYFAAAIDKHELLESSVSPKLVFVGGSNLAFGLDSEMVEQELGMPTVNMGIHAGLGLRYMLSEVEPSIGRGDIVLVIPEYSQFYGSFDGATALLDTLYVFPEGIKYLTSPKQLLVLLRELPAAIQDRFKGHLWRLIRKEGMDPVYNRNGFNRRGDVVSHLNRPSDDVSRLTLLAAKDGLSFDDEAVRTLNEFDQHARNAGATVFFAFPAIPDQQYRDYSAAIQVVCEQLERDLAMPILASPGDVVLPVSDFYDTVYHLTAEGRRARTAYIVSCLKMAAISKPDGLQCAPK